jgi:hypothetical protein
METYIRNHPVDAFGEDVAIPRELLAAVGRPRDCLPAVYALGAFNKGREAASVLLVEGAPLTRARVHSMADALQASERAAFYRGFAHPKRRARVTVHLEFEGWRDVGRAVGLARALQAFLRGYAPVASFAPDVAWELGEDVRPEDDDDRDREVRRFLFKRSRHDTVPSASPTAPLSTPMREAA